MNFTIGYKIIIIVLIILLLSHECETWSFILRAEQRLRVNEKMMLCKIFVLKTEDVR